MVARRLFVAQQKRRAGDLGDRDVEVACAVTDLGGTSFRCPVSRGLARLAPVRKWANQASLALSPEAVMRRDRFGWNLLSDPDPPGQSAG